MYLSALDNSPAMSLGKYDCIYTNGDVVSVDTGPCAPFSRGEQGYPLAVTTSAPVDEAGFTTLGWALLIGIGLFWFLERQR